MQTSSAFGSDNFWDCILDDMPDVKNDAAATEIIKMCNNKFPARSSIKEKRTPFWGVKTAGECVIEDSKNVTSPLGAKYIRAACYQLYPRD